MSVFWGTFIFKVWTLDQYIKNDTKIIQLKIESWYYKFQKAKHYLCNEKGQWGTEHLYDFLLLNES